MTTNTNTNTKKRMVVGKSFRLVDFNVYDQSADPETTNSDDTDAGTRPTRETPHFVIQMFGVDEKGETCCLYVDDYRPFFFAKVGDHWTQTTVDMFMNVLKSRREMQYHKHSIEKAFLVDYHKLYGFSGGKTHKFIQVVFKNVAAMNKMKNLWYETPREDPEALAGSGSGSGLAAPKYKARRLKPIYYQGTAVEIYESTIPPLLRYFHIHNISPSGWVFVSTSKATIPPIRTTSCTYEYICRTSHVQAQSKKETRVPYKICSFDIEASSSHGDFPVPVKTYKRLASNMADIFAIHFAKGCETEQDHTRASLLFRRTILTAFGFDTFEDVDLVYPKTVPTKSKVAKWIDLVLETPLSETEQLMGEDGGDKSHLLKIDSLFSRIAADEDQHAEVAGDDDEEADTENPPPAYPNKKDFGKSKQGDLKRGDPKRGLIDVLVSNAHCRDDKVQIANEMLTRVFPALEGDKTTFIGSTFMRYGEKEPYLNHCLVLGTCDPVEGAVIETVDTEHDLLVRWTELIQKENPDIVIGYNIFGFDYEFMFRRSQETGCTNQFLQLSRKLGEVCCQTDTNQEMGIEHTTVQLASGEYDLRYIKMMGRIQVDMYTYFRRDFNLSSYKLDDVAGQFIGDDIFGVDIWSDNQTALFSANLTGLHVGDYIHIEISGFTSDYYRSTQNGGYKFRVADIRKDYETGETDKKGNLVKRNVIVIDGDEPALVVAKGLKWGMAKDDVSPQDIFRLSRGSSADRAVVAKYCIQDCNLVHHLMNKIDVLTGYVEMSRICSVPISFLVFRGQGIKLTSYVAKKCREKKTLMPDLEKSGENDGYEGAIVLPPKCSMYMDNPVACVDYSSLYPSSMISQNLSHDSKVWTKEYDLEGRLLRETGEKDRRGNYVYDNLPGFEYIDLEFDTFQYVRKTPTSRAEKVRSGKKVCRWAQFPDNRKGIMPSILEELLKARSDTRKMIKTESDPFMQNILDKRQLGYKVTANSLYGQCGAKTSTFYEKDVAASTTATGRMMITYAKRIIEEVYGDMEYTTDCHGPVLTRAEYVYGDSVASYTPVYLRIGGASGALDVCTIESLAEKYGSGWVPCMEPGKQEKEVCELTGIETWTEKGWTPLFRVIRHALAPHKKMIRVLTHTGLVDATDDHSLLRPDGTEVSPKEIAVGAELLHHALPAIPDTKVDTDTIGEAEAEIMGFFFGDGSCGSYSCDSGKKSSWALNNASLSMINKYVALCQSVYPEFEWKVLDTIESSGVYKISPKCSKYGSIRKFVDKYRVEMYNSTKSKIIPQRILNGSEKVRVAFWRGLYDADGDKADNGNYRIDQKSQISAASIAWLCQSIGFKTSINTRADKSDIYRITATKSAQRKNPYSIKKMGEIPYDGYVYDLTTANHHFAAGVGNLIVHNTDSVFFTFNLVDVRTGEKIRGQKALEMTIEIAQDAAHLCTQWLKPPMELSYEKTLMPFILLSKKRYVGMLYETDPKKGKLKYMGLSLKRRDSCDYLKDTYGGILNRLMGRGNTDASKPAIQQAIEFLDHSLNQLVEGRVPMEKLMITKALRSDYKNPNQIAHKVLADRIGKRDPGNKPKPGDRIKFVFFANEDRKALQGDKIETPEYIMSSNLPVDYTHYITNQLMKPLQQLFGLAVEQIWENMGKLGATKTYQKEIAQLQKEFPDLETFMKKREKLASQKIKVLLFDKVLTRIHQQKNGIQAITGFFQKR